MDEQGASASPSVRRLAGDLGLALRQRLAGGEWGAYLADTVDGREVVLKVMLRHESHTVERVRRAVELTDALRRSGYPIPVFLDVGRLRDEVYTVQEFVAGTIPEPFTIDHVRQLLALWPRHEGAAAPDRVNWSDVLAVSQAAVAELADHVAGSALAPLVRRISAILDRGDPSVLRTADVSTGRVDSESAALLGETVNREIPADVRALLGAMQAVADLRFGTVSTLEPPAWILRSTAYLLDDVVTADI